MSVAQAAEERRSSESYERTTARVREARGGIGCCGCCLGLAGAMLIGGALALEEFLSWGRRSLLGLDPQQRLGLLILAAIAAAALLVAAWRTRRRLRSTTMITTRVSRRVPTRGSEGAQMPNELPGEWRPATNQLDESEADAEAGDTDRRP